MESDPKQTPIKSEVVKTKCLTCGKVINCRSYGPGILTCSNYLPTLQTLRNEILNASNSATRHPLSGRRDLICPCLSERLAAALEEGALIYGEDNWTKGFKPGTLENHIEHHWNQWKAGESAVKEDHLGHLLANVMMLIHFESNCKCHEARAKRKAVQNGEK